MMTSLNKSRQKKPTPEENNPQGSFAPLHIVSVPFWKTRPTTSNVYKLQSILLTEKETHPSLVFSIKQNSLLHTH